MKEDSAAARRTKRNFQLALMELVHEKGFHAVTIKELVEKTEYNRTTFYLYYHDKYELSESLLREKLTGLEVAVGTSYYSGQLVDTKEMGHESFSLLTYIRKERLFFDLLFVPDTLPGLLHAFPETIERIYDEQFSFQTIDHQPVNMKIFKRYMANGLYGLIREWIQSGYAKDENEFIQDLIDLTRTHIASYTFFGQTKKNQDL